jgi:hypothetical protein
MPLTFQQALLQADAQARSTLVPDLHDRLSCAVALVQDGRVFQATDGTWQVDSTSREGLTYTVNGSCPCDDHHYNAPRWCKHQLPVALSKRAIQLMAAPAAPVVPVVAPAALASPAVPLPEARSSANVRLHVHGHEVQVTLRDHDEEALLARLEHLLQRYPAPQSPVRQSGSHNAPLQGEREGWCRIHQVQMKENRKDGRMWYSHKTDQGWCKGKGVRHG